MRATRPEVNELRARAVRSVGLWADVVVGFAFDEAVVVAVRLDYVYPMRQPQLVSTCWWMCSWAALTLGGGCSASESVPEGASTRPAYPPKRMANVHDVVAYVDRNAARLGLRTFATVHDGGLYYFESAANRDKFKAAPERYTPAFNGWCSCGMAKGMRLPASGTDFEVVDGQLYLFHNAEVRAIWKQDMQAMISKGQANWTQLELP